jgi:DNA-binding LacI/PurR family transcriptional regulator
MNKVQVSMQLIRKRIQYGDHALEGFPSERDLAEETGLSRVTIRAALQQLVKEKVLKRESNGRLTVAAQHRTAGTRPVIGFVTPCHFSPDYEIWKRGLDGALEGCDVTLRPVSYAHWGESALSDALAGFDGMFFIPPSEKIPAWLATKMRNSRCRVAVLDENEVDAGLLSVVMFPARMELKLFEHLVSLGHRRIDCVNTQSEDEVIKDRIAQWREFLGKHKLSGQLRALTIHRSMEAGYSLIRDVLREGRPLGTALFCTTSPAAIGAMRAIHEATLEIGRDVSVCTVNDEGMAPYLLKTLTSLESPSRARYLRPVVEWMLSGKKWEGSLLIQPKDLSIYVGESTGPAPRHDKVVVAG